MARTGFWWRYNVVINEKRTSLKIVGCGRRETPIFCYVLELWKKMPSSTLNSRELVNSQNLRVEIYREVPRIVFGWLGEWNWIEMA